MVSDATSLAGKRIGAYRLGKQLGRGGMSEVYKARHKDGHNVALKILIGVLAREPKALARFEREAQAARALKHPNIVKVIDVGRWRGHHYIAMEQLRPLAFRRMVRRGDDPAKTIAALLQVARALAFAHGRGVVHRDIKPDNILMNRAGTTKVVDFGLAHVQDASSITTDGAMLGTAKYMSPEQARGEDAKPASDIYSFGVVLYEAISGDLPFESKTQHGFLLQHAEQRPPKPQLRPGFPAPLAKLAMTCLSKNPAARPTASELVRMIQRATRRRRSSRRVALWLAAAGLAVAAGAVLVAPSSLDPWCQGWFGAGFVERVRDAAYGVRELFATTGIGGGATGA